MKTGARIAGRLGWIHSASTTMLTRYTAHQRRGTDAMDDAGVLPDFRGTAVHDGWKPYCAYDLAMHALCGAHHLRELRTVHEHGHQWAAEMSALFSDTPQSVEQAKARGASALKDKTLAAIHRRYRAVIASGFEQHPDLAATARQNQTHQSREPSLAPGRRRA
ncbi:MAG: IS66 family transposase [Solirubrobacteraceae bacterium]